MKAIEIPRTIFDEGDGKPLLQEIQWVMPKTRRGRFMAWARSKEAFPGWFEDGDGNGDIDPGVLLLFIFIMSCGPLTVFFLWWWGYL